MAIASVLGGLISIAIRNWLQWKNYLYFYVS
jgi:hypothetical protein